MIHRKKETNTLYTVNALNTVIRFENNGVLDKRYQIDWNRYRNSLILSDDGELRHIYLKMVKKISL
jgi:predicted amidohydrolase